MINIIPRNKTEPTPKKFTNTRLTPRQLWARRAICVGIGAAAAAVAIKAYVLFGGAALTVAHRAFVVSKGVPLGALAGASAGLLIVLVTERLEFRETRVQTYMFWNANNTTPVFWSPGRERNRGKEPAKQTESAAGMVAATN